jgi:hypothetical protein
MTDNPQRLTVGFGGVRLQPDLPSALLSDCLQLPAAFPDAGQCLPQFLVRDVEVPLCGLDVGVPEHQLDGADIDAVRQEAAGAFVTQIVPVKVDLLQLGPVDTSAGFRALGIARWLPGEGLPGGLEAVLEFSIRGAEHERLRT